MDNACTQYQHWCVDAKYEKIGPSCILIPATQETVNTVGHVLHEMVKRYSKGQRSLAALGGGMGCGLMEEMTFFWDV